MFRLADDDSPPKHVESFIYTCGFKQCTFFGSICNLKLSYTVTVGHKKSHLYLEASRPALEPNPLFVQ